jgi:ParB-like chromosome segregation protein Spo0J
LKAEIQSVDRKLGDFQIDPARIKPNEDTLDNSIFKNARSTLKKEEMTSQRESIRKLGLLKSPIVRPIKNDPDGYTHQIVCGSRRHRNILKLRQQAEGILRENRDFTHDELCLKPETGEWLPATVVYATITCCVRDCDDETAIAINLAENLEHAKVPELDLMDFCQYLVELKNPNGGPRYSREWIADKCNRSESWVSLTLELNQLPEKVKNLMSEGRITRTAALQFLQTERDKINDVIETGQKIIREEKQQEVKLAEAEIQIAEIELEDAKTDLEIHEMTKNTNLMQIANKRIGTARKRVSSASEKREVALKEVENPKFTADTIAKANLLVPGAKKGAPKSMPNAEVKKLYKDFKDYRKTITDSNDTLVYNVIESLFESILGHKLCAGVAALIEEEKSKLEV